MLLQKIAAGGTAVINLDFVPERIMVVDDTTGLTAFANITQFSLVQSGRQLANLTGTRVAAFARLSNLIIGASQALAEGIALGLGRINGSATITLVSNSANILSVFGVSSGFSNVLANYVETSINANANQSFAGFNALLLSTPANIDRVNITMEPDGFNDDYTPQELRQLLGATQNTDTNGVLNGNLVVPGSRVRNAIVFVNGTGNCVVGVQRFLQS